MIGRTDTGSRVIKASPRSIYRAFLDPIAIAAWRPPAGMIGRVISFDPRPGGVFRMAWVYENADPQVRGKTSEREDEFVGRFLELVPDRRIVELVEFEADDPDFKGAMTITTELVPVLNGTEVTVRIDNVPRGISAEDHQAGIASSLENLARFTEQASTEAPS